MQDWKQISEAITGASVINVFTHIHSDGDCVGSAFALAYFLSNFGKKINIICEEKPPENLAHIYEAELPENIKFYVYDENNAADTEIPCGDAAIAVDVSDSKRLGARQELFFKAPVTVRIDHHISNDTFANVTVCNSQWAATAEGIWEYVKNYENWEKIPYITEIAKSVYTGILTDTGSFAYSNVTPDTHSIAAETIRVAGSMAWIYSAIYENQTKEEIALKAMAYGKVEYFEEGKIAYLQITREEMEKTGADDDALSGLAPFLRSIKGVSVGILVKPGKLNGQWRLSLRSDEHCDVNAVANAFGGGGHIRASGLTYLPESGMPFDEFKEKLIGEVKNGWCD